MLTTTRRTPIILLAGTISVLTPLACFTAFTAPTRADSRSSESPLPGFADPFNKTPVLGYTPGLSQIRLADMRDDGPVTNYISI